MTARLVHQVRTPLASALLYASQLAADSPGQKDIVGKLTKRLQELGQMTEDLLGFARDVRPADEAVAVTVLMQEVADNFASPEQRDAITIRPGSQKVTVVADRNALRGALINLVENALQASTAEPRIELRAEEADDSVYFAVADNGRGIAPDALPRLFEPFFTTRPGGTGLGLAIVRAVADAHDGNVGVESGAQGTTFTLRLPKSGGRE